MSNTSTIPSNNNDAHPDDGDHNRGSDNDGNVKTSKSNPFPSNNNYGIRAPTRL